MEDVTPQFWFLLAIERSAVCKVVLFIIPYLAREPFRRPTFSYRSTLDAMVLLTRFLPIPSLLRLSFSLGLEALYTASLCLKLLEWRCANPVALK